MGRYQALTLNMGTDRRVKFQRDIQTQTPNPMKRMFTIIALAAAFGLAFPATSEAAPHHKKGKHHSSQVVKNGRHKGGGMMVVRDEGRHHHHGITGPGRYSPRYWPEPVYVSPPEPEPYYYHRRPRPLLEFLFRL
jgi:hypothetical protein